MDGDTDMDPDADQEDGMDAEEGDGEHEDGDRDEREQEDSHEDHGNTDMSAALTGFLFGNIDEKGELEVDFLDEVIQSLFI